MASERNETFPKRLQRLREKRGVSRRVLSELCGLHDKAVVRFERGERKPSPDALCALADYFGVTVDYLLCREQEK
jgi:transcriptional regulator with XRE-family HTH domain